MSRIKRDDLGTYERAVFDAGVQEGIAVMLGLITLVLILVGFGVLIGQAL